MIVFDLSCEYEHCFEAWFKNNEDFKVQLANGLLTCPICESNNIIKIPSASRLNLGKQQKEKQNLPSTQIQKMGLQQQLSKFIEQHFQDVGSEFAETAKKMHYGEEHERNIRGTATREEAEELIEQGIDVIPLPGNTKQLN